MELINLAFYRFFPLETIAGPDLQLYRRALKERLRKLDLRGTILLAPEGINAMVSGPRASIDAFRALATQDWGIPGPLFKEGPCDAHSFSRLLVKVKREIITVGDPTVRPDQKTAPRVSARELKQWLDEGRPITLLDTRNDYEIEVGTFRGAKDWGLRTSREFSARAREHLPELENRTVVTFCTGGIRCEKASAALLQFGLDDVYQLDGGILRYFEENGSAHFDGNCFVFDWRLAVDGKLQPIARSDDPQAEFGRHR